MIEDPSDFLDSDEFAISVEFSRDSSELLAMPVHGVELEVDGQYLTNQVTLNLPRSAVGTLQKDEFFTAENGDIYTFLQVIEDDGAFVLIRVDYKSNA